MSDDFAVGRIVPSTRDLFGAVATRRRGLALLPLIDSAASAGGAAEEAARLERLDVRAFAVADWGANLRAVATATSATPSLCLRVVTAVDDCQRARFYGADGVAIEAGDEAAWLNLSKAAQSMRMMAFAACEDAAHVRRAASWGARAALVPSVGDFAGDLDKTLIVVCHAVEVVSLAGRVDAAVVPKAVHAGPDFRQLLDTLDS